MGKTLNLNWWNISLRLFYWFGYSLSIFIENQRKRKRHETQAEMNILLKSEDEAKVLCHGHTKKLFLISWNALILRVEINIELLASYLSANSVPDSKNNHSKPWLTFKLSLYLSFGSVGSCSFSHLMISLQIIFQKCTMKCRKSHVFLLSSLWT